MNSFPLDGAKDTDQYSTAHVLWRPNQDRHDIQSQPRLWQRLAADPQFQRLGPFPTSESLGAFRKFGFLRPTSVFRDSYHSKTMQKDSVVSLPKTSKSLNRVVLELQNYLSVGHLQLCSTLWFLPGENAKTSRSQSRNKKFLQQFSDHNGLPPDVRI